MKIKFVDASTGYAAKVPCTFTIGILLTLAISCSTMRKTRPAESFLKPNDSVLTDRDGNRYVVKKMPGNDVWMTVNVKLRVPGSYCYENEESNCEAYGRLYTWASAQKICGSLGKGWVLPSNDDWQRLVMQNGSESDSADYRKKAYQALLSGGSSGFNAVLGGGRDLEGKYARLGAHGFYWAATETDSATAWFSNFAKGSQALYQQNNGEKQRAFSVRCVCRTGK